MLFLHVDNYPEPMLPIRVYIACILHKAKKSFAPISFHFFHDVVNHVNVKVIRNHAKITKVLLKQRKLFQNCINVCVAQPGILIVALRSIFDE